MQKTPDKNYDSNSNLTVFFVVFHVWFLETSVDLDVRHW